MNDVTDFKRILTSFRNGKKRKICGLTVCRYNDRFEVNGEICTLDAAAQLLSESAGQERRGPDYTRVVYLEKPPYSCAVLRTYRIRSRAEHKRLVEEVRKRGNYLWLATVVERDGKHYVIEPHIIDWDSVPAHPADVRPDKDNETGHASNGLSCPFCHRRVTSTSGRTLHIKSKHPDRFDEYMRSVVDPSDRHAAMDGSDGHEAPEM